MKLLVCGGRDYHKKARIERVLDNMKNHIDCLVCGGATGVDFYSSKWAVLNQIKTVIIPAEWDKHGRAAGPIRNQRMLDEERPDKVLAFPGSRGTEDMVSRATKAGIEVIRVED